MAAACAVILLRVLKIERAYRAINWNVLIMVASLIPLSTAMYKTGAAYLIADTLVAVVGNASPYALLAGLFLLTALIGQLISSTATTLIVIPIAIASAEAVGVSPRTALVTVAVAAAASFLRQSLPQRASWCRAPAAIDLAISGGWVYRCCSGSSW
ncbi:SLC13 family permease [Bradyrhizobium japonicum]